MFKALIELAASVASIIDRKGERKYKEKLLELERAYDKENSKERPDMARLYSIERELCRIVRIFDSEIRGETTKAE